jgi:hypothetical protein
MLTDIKIIETDLTKKSLQKKWRETSVLSNNKRQDYELEHDLKQEFKLRCSVDTSLD